MARVSPLFEDVHAALPIVSRPVRGAVGLPVEPAVAYIVISFDALRYDFADSPKFVVFDRADERDAYLRLMNDDCIETRTLEWVIGDFASLADMVRAKY